jgi:solute:Na+ symporter, SSS family
VAALLAALMGAMSAVFNSASTMVTLDFYKRVRPEATERQLVNFGRMATAVMVGLGILWVPFIHLLSSQLYIYLQSVQAYVSPPIAACFVLGVLWSRANAAGAFASLMVGFVLGALRFALEVLDKSEHYTSGAVRWLVDMNFLHYAIFMFVVCTAILIVGSLITPAPERRQLAGLTFAMVDAKLDAVAVAPVHAVPKETLRERQLNVAFTTLLVATVVGLWIYFR